MGLKLSGVGILATFLLVAGVFAYFRKDLPNIRDVSGNNIGGSVFYYDRSGQTLLWEDVDGVKRIPVKTEQMSKYIRNATIAIEDRDFYNHCKHETDCSGFLKPCTSQLALKFHYYLKHKAKLIK